MNAFYIICGLGLFSLLAEIINLKKWLVFLLTLGLIAAGFFIVKDWNTGLHHFSDMVVFDNTALAFSGLICLIAFFWFWMAGNYFHEETHITDHAALIIFSIAGAIILTAFDNMAMLFLGIEILSISLYVLAGSRKQNLLSNEAAFKYFLMGSFATGFLLMGIALVYGATGSFNLEGIAAYTSTHFHELPTFFYAGVFMIMIGIAFKISAVPFHFWAPDVYEGSPTPVTAFMSTIVKIAAFAAFIRLFSVAFVSAHTQWNVPLQVIMISTLVLANVTAVFQNNVKRMLAYSSVGHAGYILLAFISGIGESTGTIFYYLTVYSIASLAAFTVLIQFENTKTGLDVSNFNGLFKKNPFLAVAMTIALLSLAGIPPLAGFFGKYLVFALAVKHGYVGFVIVGVITSLIGVYYYFRVIIAMFLKDSDTTVIEVSTLHKVLLFVLVLLTIALGIAPDFLHIL
jgi:NADH-quinone oxidoreductase subunit N